MRAEWAGRAIPTPRPLSLNPALTLALTVQSSGRY
jgi:hypothetical protein